MGDVTRLVQLTDTDEDGDLDLNEWVAALRPKRPCARTSPVSPNLSLEQRNLFQRSWLEQLAALFGLLIQTDSELNSLRNQLMLDGKRLFKDMDRHNLGYISANNFAYWVEDNCGFCICDEDLLALETTLDGEADYRINKEAFV